MLLNTADCEANHSRFVARVAESEIVWALKNEDGYAVADSDDDPKRSVLLFWSDRAYAQRAADAEFPDFQPSTIALFDFLFRWLPGMSRQKDLAGTNWTGDLVGLELDPIEVQDQVTDSLTEDQCARFSEALRQSIEEEHNG